MPPRGLPQIEDKDVYVSSILAAAQSRPAKGGPNPSIFDAMDASVRGALETMLAVFDGVAPARVSSQAARRLCMFFWFL